MASVSVQTSLSRRVGLWLLTFYGLGNILGAGIYVLVGKVAGAAGYLAPLSFVLAAVVAAFTAFTYAELSARYPVAAGEAVYVNEGFGRAWLSLVVGLSIAFAGMFSAAAMARGFAGYAQTLFAMPDGLLVGVSILLLGLVAAWGIGISVRIASLLTLFEIAGLLLIIGYGASQLDELPSYSARLGESGELPAAGVLLGAFLAFFAFLGFEDMVNIAEEVRDPVRTLPKAIFMALSFAALLYAGVTFVAVLAVAPEALADSKAPLADVYSTLSGHGPVVIGFIGIMAVINGALVQMIMVSRMLYGLARNGWLPAALGEVSATTHTPLPATAFVTMTTLALALWLPIEALAAFTSYLLLVVFLLVNLALLRIKRLPAPAGVRVYPRWIPVAGATGAILLITAQVLL